MDQIKDNGREAPVPEEMSTLLLRQLLNESERQMSICDCTHEATSPNATVILLEQMAPDYHSNLAEFADKLKKYYSDIALRGSAPDVPFPYPKPQLFWQIPTFCEPSLYVDAQRCKLRCMALHDINFREEFWDSGEAFEWASTEESSIILVQGDYQTTDAIEEIALDLVQYLEENCHPAVWILNDMTSNKHLTTADGILKQLAVQILQKNLGLHSVQYLPRSVEHFQRSSKNMDWFDVIRFVLQGMSRLCMVIDLGILGAAYETASSWMKQFSILFEKLRLENASVLKVAILSCWPLPRSDTPPLTIDIIAQAGSLSLQRAHRVSETTTGLRTLPFPVPRPEPKPIAPRIIGEVARERSGKGPRDWFSEMKSFEEIIDASRKEPDAAHPRVRVAIFDTGLDLSHRDIRRAQEQGRLKFNDFVENSDNITDENGHGTHCTSLLLKYAPNAEVFAGRVFRKGEADEHSCGILTKAVRYAVEVWRVDIISISLGFKQDDDEDADQLREEIRKASANNTLVFASAANNTNNESKPVRFPARMKEVICVFSSDSFGRPSDFNPVSKYDRPNLTFPGEKVKGAWPSYLADDDSFESRGATYKRQSGTSCSTPIAAAVAAGVLEFVWQEREPVVRRVRLLKHYTGMTQIFLRRMIDEYRVGDNSYNYVKPWKLISTSRRKNEIPVLISDSLDHVDG